MTTIEERLIAALREAVGSAECCPAVDAPLVVADFCELVMVRRHRPGCVLAPGVHEVAAFTVSLTPIGQVP
ncbi:hypothetical protein [Micromonospora aurantiaca (nom. illeg.)]|uniref:hypothetical protein n=1 Tax=Micromonospora aurantiaca (nom. illeg.) TaxID=47850 RepID=UPI000B809E41|nr:hypothetical protein [Micromonospora aurantiaca]